ncbi:MAG: hypothetical protein WBP93_04845 [Pyrinomonadaceae bacterium]
MAKVKNEETVARRKANEPDSSYLLALASERVHLPDVPMLLDYQDDVDTLCIHFEGSVSPNLLDEDDELEHGVIGIYDDEKLVGIEILDITGQLKLANPT